MLLEEAQSTAKKIEAIQSLLTKIEDSADRLYHEAEEDSIKSEERYINDTLLSIMEWNNDELAKIVSRLQDLDNQLFTVIGSNHLYSEEESEEEKENTK